MIDADKENNPRKSVLFEKSVFVFFSGLQFSKYFF